MKTLEKTITDWNALTHRLGETFAEFEAENDEQGAFVYANYELLREHKYFSLLVPTEFGGAGLSFPEVCDIIRVIGHYSGSTALALSMHQHLVAATLWKYIHKGEGAPLLKKVAEQQLVLVSTGARDWLASNGEMEKVEGGYLLNGKKHFASQSAGGDIAVTSAPYLNENDEWRVLHFGVSMDAEGVSVLDDWHVLGMRATGSQTIQFRDVFIPDSAISLDRPKDEFHPVWSVVLTVALPLVMSAYVGIAERAQEKAISIGKKYARNQKHIHYIFGKMNNELIKARVQWKAMIERTNNFDFSPNPQTTCEMLSLKTNVAEACMSTVSQAMEGIGGQSFYQKNELERLFRDIQASQFHPLPRWDQYEFTGRQIMTE